jgi:hypothetical protein
VVQRKETQLDSLLEYGEVDRLLFSRESSVVSFCYWCKLLYCQQFRLMMGDLITAAYIKVMLYSVESLG